MLGSRPGYLKENNPREILEGTTRKVFKYVYRQRKPVRVYDVQRGLGLSSPSVAHYHIGKLLKAGLLKEEEGGYVADKVIFESMIRIRRTALPFRTAYAVFFLTALIGMVSVMRPTELSSLYVFAVAVVSVALTISLIEVYEEMSERM